MTFNNQELSDLADCGQDSFYQEYLAGLSWTASWAMEEHGLVLELAGGEGRLGFQDSGAIDEGAGPGAEAMDPDSVSIDTMGLSDTWKANLVEATAYDDSQPPGPMGLPEHMQVVRPDQANRTA